MAGPASISECVRERRSARKPVMVSAPRPNPLPRWKGPTGGATQASSQSRQDAARFRPSDAAPPSPDSGVGGRELHDRRMSNAGGSPLCVSRTERCPEQTDDERQWKQALAREIHDFCGRLGFWKRMNCFDYDSTFARARESNVDSG